MFLVFSGWFAYEGKLNWSTLGMNAFGWTIGGAIPRRIGHSGMTPESWADGSHKWDGYLTTAESPRIVDPPTFLREVSGTDHHFRLDELADTMR